MLLGIVGQINLITVRLNGLKFKGENLSWITVYSKVKKKAEKKPLACIWTLVPKFFSHVVLL